MPVHNADIIAIFEEINTRPLAALRKLIKRTM